MRNFILAIFIYSSIFAQKVTLVHGLGNVGSLFNGTEVEQTVNNVLNPPLVLKPSLGGETSANNQSSNLENTLVSNNVDGGLSVSYSMGGIVTRNYMMNEYSSGYNRLNGHISIGTPHLGAKLATNSALASLLVKSQISAILFPASLDYENGVIYYPHESMRDLTLVILNQFIAAFILDANNNAAIQDLRTDSDVVANINNSSNFETNIFKGGIYCREDEPVLYNMSAHAAGISESTVSYILDFVYTVKIAYIIYHIYNYYYAVLDGNDYWASYHYGRAITHLSALSFLSDFNFLWKRDILESDYSDGIVGENSQKYPNANRQYLALNTSHLEELNHDKVKAELTKSLNDYNYYVKLANPIVPKGVSIAWYNDHPKITWNSNQEHDIQSYKVWKYAGGSSMIAGTITHNPSNSTHSWIDNSVDLPGRFDPQIEYTYKVKAIDDLNNESLYSEEVSIIGAGALWKENVEEESGEIITEYALNSNYPNPFNPTTQISYQLPENSFVNLGVYNALGQKVEELVNQHQSSGKYTVKFDASNLPSGVYIYKLQTEKFSDVKKMLLTK